MKRTLASVAALFSLAAIVRADQVVLVLDGSAITASSYAAPFGSGNGVYLATPDGTPPANDIPYYLWPGGAEESLSNNLTAVADATAPLGQAAWEAAVQPANDGAGIVLFHPHEIFGNGTYVLSDLQEISWRTRKGDPATSPDWYITLWLDAGGGNVAFLVGEPYWSNNLSAPADAWNQWTVSTVPGGTNEVQFHEPGFACTNFGWSEPPAMPTLGELVAGSYTWNGVPSQTFLPGCAGTPNPLTTTIDYSVMPILGIGIGLGNPWAGPFQGRLDDLRVRLAHPTIPGATDELIVDFAQTAPTVEPAIEKAFSPATVPQGGTSTLTFSLANPNASPLGNLSFVDALPSGMAVASSPGLSNTCGGTVVANPGGTQISLSHGLLESTCEIHVAVTATAAGDLVNTSGPLTTTTLQFPGASGSDTAQATLSSSAADVRVEKSAASATATPGDSLAYTLVVTNDGPSDDPGVVLTDVLPVGLTCTFDSVAGGGASGNTPAGAGDLAETLSMPAGSSVTYSLDCAVDPAATGTLTNTASIVASLPDPNIGNDTATTVTSLAPTADLHVTKTDGTTSVGPGESLIYTIAVTNEGPSVDPSVAVNDVLPPELACTFTSLATAGATGNTPVGSGDLAETLSLAPGSTVTYTLDCTVAPGFRGLLSNTVSLLGSVTDPTPGDRAATDADTLVEGSVLEIPAAGAEGLILLALLLGAAGLLGLRR